MMRLLLVGDGTRDHAVLPHLLQTILNGTVDAECIAWKELHVRGSGYKGKTMFVLNQAEDSELDGVVAVVDKDEDKKRKRLREMIDGRNQFRARGHNTPAALGEANPHGEAWLLDDPVAVRTGMSLASDATVISPTKTKNPKGELESLLANSERADHRTFEVWADIAKEVDPTRCTHAKSTGFAAFVADVKAELGPLVSNDTTAQ